MADSLEQVYRERCLPHLKAALCRALNHPADVVRRGAMYRQVVIDPGWEAMPSDLKALGRKDLRWDELLLKLRKATFKSVNGRLTFHNKVEQAILEVLKQVFGNRTLWDPAPDDWAVEMDDHDDFVAELLLDDAPVDEQEERALNLSALSASTPTAAPDPQSSRGKSPEATLEVSEISLGIDLGTTYSVVAYLDVHGKPCTIVSSAGELTTPSVILMEDDGPVVGREAVLGAASEPQRIAVCVKRDMGARTYGKKVNGQHFPPEVLSAMILRALKEDAERKLGSVSKAVITVPAYFDETRRRATLDAGRLAGLDVLGIVNEPTAAAIAYGYELGFLDRDANVVGDDPLRVLVYDLGGGTFDVTIVELTHQSFRALATDGDVRLGGKDWDEKLVEIAAKQILTKVGEDLRHTRSTLEELWQVAEAAKKTLSERSKATMYVNYLGSRHAVEVTRTEFEQATSSLLGRTRTTTEIVLREANLKWGQIDHVLLVGGSTRMPMVVRMLQEMSGKEPSRSVSPDEAVAHGAALYAELLHQQGSKLTGRMDPFRVSNVNSHSLGILGIDRETGKDKNYVLIPKNTPLPVSVTKTCETNRPNQRNVMIRIVEGDSPRPEACIRIGTCKIDRLPPNLPKGWPIHVQYSYLADGQLRVSALVKGQSDAVVTVIERERNLTEEEMLKWKESLGT